MLALHDKSIGTAHVWRGFGLLCEVLSFMMFGICTSQAKEFTGKSSVLS